MVEHVRLTGGRHQLGAQPFAEGEMLEVDAEIDG
jgi:hypothetical protein